ncbi:hypothetical protein SO802_016202 [Lithocarpus litseifolius]|uniref:RNase H type-1 domain-containing protein n=1 Tax=Lithocarpus litseifolius TaxID=425828 RepID=A0AAW2D171_9ROSI
MCEPQALGEGRKRSRPSPSRSRPSHGTEVWSASKPALPFTIHESWSFVDTFSKLRNCWEAQPEMLEKWVTICWGIWKSRNEVRHGGKKQTGLFVVRSSLKLLEEFQTVNETPKWVSFDHMDTTAWKRPPPGCFKVNIDGALFSKAKQSGIGVIVRDEEGNVIAALCKKLDFLLGTLEIKAKALEVGVQFAEEIGLRNVVFEADSLLIINSVHGVEEAVASIQNIIHGVLRKVQSFRTFDFLHTRRQENVPAHLLAQYAQNVENRLYG